MSVTPVFPGAIAGDSQLGVAANRIKAILRYTIGAADLSATLVSTAGIVPNMILNIDNEELWVCSVDSTANIVHFGHSACPNIDGRGWDGTTARAHNAGAYASAFIDAWNHNSVSAEINAIETALGVNLANASAVMTSTRYNFAAQTPGGALIIGSNVITLVPVPAGVNGADLAHYVWISGGTGTAEAVLITGGTAVAGASSGTIIVTCANTHSGAWTVQSASAGIAEACVSARSAGGGYVSVPGGTFTINAPVRIFGNTTVYGTGIYGTLLQRTGDFGHTFVIGTATGGDNCVRIFDMRFVQVINFVTGTPPTVSNKPTSGAHIVFNGGNSCQVIRCRFENMPEGISIVGGSEITVQDCAFLGVWSIGYASAQISIADVLITFDAVLGTPTYIKLRGNLFIAGPSSPAGVPWGPEYRVAVFCVEDLEISGGSLAAATIANVLLAPSSSHILANVRICAARFDGCSGNEINITTDGTASASNVTVTGCIFNGETLGLAFAYTQAALAVANFGSGVPAVIGLDFSGNVVFNYYYSAISVLDGLMWQIANNVIYLYNTAVSAASSQASGIYVAGRATNGLINGNLIGGDNTGASAYGAGNNKCLFGIFVLAPTVANSAVTLDRNFAPFPTAIGTATDQMFNAILQTPYYVATETGANNALAVAVPNVVLIAGLRLCIKLAHSLQAGANTINMNAVGAVALKSSRNVANNIGTAYVSGGTITVEYDGTEWVDLSQ